MKRNRSKHYSFTFLRFNLLPTKEVSALENYNIKESIVLMAREIYNEKELWKMESKEKGAEKNIIDLRNEINQQINNIKTGIVSKVVGVISCGGR